MSEKESSNNLIMNLMVCGTRVVDNETIELTCEPVAVHQEKITHGKIQDMLLGGKDVRQIMQKARNIHQTRLYVPRSWYHKQNKNNELQLFQDLEINIRVEQLVD